jgi:hypothetical protein
LGQTVGTHKNNLDSKSSSLEKNCFALVRSFVCAAMRCVIQHKLRFSKCSLKTRPGYEMGEGIQSRLEGEAVKNSVLRNLNHDPATVLYSAVPCHTVPHSAVQCSTTFQGSRV